MISTQMIRALLLLSIMCMISSFQVMKIPLRIKYTCLSCTMKNGHSYYSNHEFVNNSSKNIDRLYTTFDNKYTLICYKDGSVDEILNKTLKLKYDYDILNVFIVSNKYFKMLYKDLHQMKNDTLR